MRGAVVLLLGAAASVHAGCADQGSQRRCDGNGGCLWNAAWAPGLCTNDPCIANINQQMCEAAAVTMPFPCQAPPGDPDFCFVAACEYNPRNAQSCSAKRCLHDEEGSCSAAGCTWTATPSQVGPRSSPGDKMTQCREDFCGGLNTIECQVRGGCQFSRGQCTMKECGAHQNERECDHDRKCHWDVSGRFCGDTGCGGYGSKAACAAQAPCMYDDNHNACVPKTCDKYNHPEDRCGCAKDPDCTWKQTAGGGYCSGTSYNACPDLDIAFVLDGSGSTRRSFGRHPHGFYGLMEILREWVKTVPLTGDDHKAGANGKTGTGAFRMTFIQFSKAEARPDEDHPVGCRIGQCTDGLLSGRLDELEGDIDWHEANYQAQWTYMHDALQDVADHTFLPSQSPPERQHIVIIIADGGITDINGDACCEKRCGDRRCIDRRWLPRYPGMLDAAQAKLKTEDVTVFGIVMRRFDYHTFQDDNAEVKLKPLVAEPRDDHFMNLMLDEIPKTVLGRLCDPNSKFGKQLQGGSKTTTKGCPLMSMDACEASSMCQWDSSRLRCTESICYSLCKEPECNTNALCQWTSDRCELKPPGCPSKNQQDCTRDATCLWDPIWKDKCIDNPCIKQKTSDSCTAHSVTMPTPCRAPFGDPDFCKLEVCEHDKSNNPSCNVKKCLQITKGTCEAEKGCVWSGPDPVGSTVSPSGKVGMCNPEECKHTTQDTCDKDPKCDWDGMTPCAPKPCTQHKNEKDCDHDLSCKWDLTKTPTQCTLTECSKHAGQDPCDKDPQCMWSASGKVCVPKTCDKHKAQCPCDKDSDCVWHHTSSTTGGYCTPPKFNACPDLDIAFILDGSGSMRRSFGRHPHGFYGLVEIMRTWVRSVPLTGDDHKVGAAASRDAGFRMTFIQFSKAEARPDEDHPMGCRIGQCTDGLLSGRLDELEGDLDWHEANYQGQWTYLHDALQDVADHTFLPSQSPSWRQHIAILIADGGLTDYNGDACCEDRCDNPRCIDPQFKTQYRGMLDAAQEKLRSEGVSVFGIVIRRFSYHTFQDDNAEVKLTPLVTAPTDTHFMSLELDEIPESVLNALCDPSSKFGQHLVVAKPGCASKTEQGPCVQDKACKWDASMNPSCVESECYALCEQPTCDANSACKWTGSACEYKPPGCTGKDQPQCAQDKTCLWDPLWTDKCIENPCRPPTEEPDCLGVSVTVSLPCTPPAGDPDFCKLDVCDFDPTRPNKCEVKKCLQITKGTCEAEKDCVWSGPDPVGSTVSPSGKVGMCNPKPCAHTTQDACDKDPQCDWDGKTPCAPKPCTQHKNEKDCDHDLSCKWDLGKTPAQCTLTECAKHAGKDTCDQDPQCMKAPAGKDCVPKTCEKHKEKCDCNKDADCVWHHGAGNAYCTSKNFDKCPDLDIAFILDASGSMKRSFGRHPHGFYGLVEILRTWVRSVPLTGDDHTVGAGAKRDAGFRMTFVQFSKAEAKPEDSHTTGCSVGGCTNGLLSGRMDELEGDLDWHEENYQAQWTYLHDALQDVADNTFVTAQSPAWRKHVVIIVADGGLTDYDGDACCEDRCANPKCIDPQFKTQYRGMLDSAQAKLKSEDVTVFGIVMRRFAQRSFQDENAEEKLQPMVGIPAYDHFMSLELDEIPDSVLNALCDPSSKFGKKLAVAASGCPKHDTQQGCSLDTACKWDGTKTPSCMESECYPLCDEATCNTNPVCKWNGQDCEHKPPGCAGKDQPQCKKDDTCLWDPLWTDKCIDNPCRPPTEEPDCLGVSVTMPLPCTPPAGDPDFCKLDVCDFDPTRPNKCEVKECLQITKGTCEAEKDCVWSGPDPVGSTVSPSGKVGMCNPKPCAHTTQDACDKDPQCDWDGMTPCAPKPCTQHKNEKDCDHDLSCHWGVGQTPAQCTLTECAKHAAKDTCDQDPQCMKATDKDCVPKTCEKHKDRCPCQNDPECVWKQNAAGGFCSAQQFKACPDLDIAFILDASGSMKRSFGRHPHGFTGLVEILRDWVKTVPLTGDDHTVGAGAKSDSGFRVTFMQFSKAAAKPEDNHATGCAVGACTNGLLSGDRNELSGDLDWLEENYQGQWTYLHGALLEVADSTFAAAQSPASRKHIVIIVADGGLTDHDGDSCCKDACGVASCIDPKFQTTYPGTLDTAQAKLRAEGADVFGIVIRRFDKHSFDDENAEVKLKPLLSSPGEDHLANVELDEVAGSVLDTLCDPTSKFGKFLAVPLANCPDLDETACGADKACEWDAQTGKCGESECHPLCTEATCDTNRKCYWGGKECKLAPLTPAPATPAPLTAVPGTPTPETPAPGTAAPGTPAPGTSAPPTAVPETPTPPTEAPTPAPTPEPLVDECMDHPATCGAGQTCQDPDQKKGGDWQCVCPPPNQHIVKAGGPADCAVDECQVHDITCRQQAQQCKDPDLSKKGDWQCVCIPPQTGQPGAAQPAVCVDPPGDCKVNGDVCHSVGQACNAGTDPKNGKFECECIPPATGTNGKNVPAECKLDECVVVCPTCNLKKGGAKICEDAGQECEDLNTSPTSLLDWRCKCPPPSTGAATAKAATCELDECKVKCPTCANKDGKGNICEKAGQSCVEKSLTTLSDWECVCQDPKTGRALTAVALCDEDECRTHEQVCVTAGQTCDDTDRKASGSWVCKCPPPSTTSAVGAAAQCEEDECSVAENRKKCEDVAQTCKDPDAATMDNWMCVCPPPSKGTQKLGPVTVCVLDECTAQCPTCADNDGKGNVCVLKDQTCHDPVTTASSLSDWTCTCKSSGKFAVAAPVDKCEGGRDECHELSGAVQCQHLPRYSKEGCLCSCGWTAVFKDMNGVPIKMPAGPGSTEPCNTGCCNPNGAAEGDWCYIAANSDYNKNKPECAVPRGSAIRQSCLAEGTVPQDGGKPARPGIPGVPQGQNNVCTDAEQLCVDPNKMVDGDWQCQCVMPQTGPPGMQKPAVCGVDECAQHSATCEKANQRCVDDDKSGKSLDDWFCVCVTGGKMSRQQKAPAACDLDECIETCPTCATGNGTDVCTAVGQVCEDPNISDKSLSDWMCKCPPPSLGSRVAAPVDQCVLDECVVKCATCADKDDGKGNLCASAKPSPQECEDKDKSVSSRNDWVCKCPPPSHTFAVTNVALCEEDECEQHTDVCPHGQMCFDPDETKKGDWYCECVPPAVGANVGASAECEEDECKVHAEVCRSAGQQCEDPDLKTKATWLCKCVAPDAGVPGQQTPARCLPPPECQGANQKVCADADQHCNDPDAAVVGDWECTCIPPYKGAPQKNGPATCELDECTAVCSTCQKSQKDKQGVCELHGQDCEDPDKTKTGDWMCKCVPPSKGSPMGLGAAVCQLDECVEMCDTCAGATCSDAGQECADMSTSPKHLKDWVCKCPPPSTDSRTVAAVSSCTDDECKVHRPTCVAAGQICVDPGTSKVGDWECHCPPPASGSKQGGPVDTCTTNECATVCPTCADKDGRGNVCVVEEQECVDPDHTVLSNWYCKCTIGTSFKVGGPVEQCIVDECASSCETCANKGGGNVCEDAGQECIDVNTAGYAGADWQCRCPPPLQAKFTTNGVAVCSLDECTDAVDGKVPGSVCADGGQLCHDSHLDTLGDFDCVCPPPQQGTKTAGLATCTTDECLIHGDQCKQANQTCVDPDLQTMNDWECVCPPPSASSRKLGAAVCEVDECVENRYVCEGAQPPQGCVDANQTRSGDWQCVCRAPSTGSAVAVAAECKLDECVGQCATCAKTTCSQVGQTCTDPNPSFRSLNDWVCKCPPPSTMSAVAAAAQCPVDECERAAHVCLASKQNCIDPNTAGNSLGDWECHCPPPAVGASVKGPAECLVDECKKHGHVCSERGQMCVDPNKHVDSLKDWECHCVAPSTGAKAVLKPAECVLVGECEDPTVSDVCTTAGQVCDDPDVAKKGDWRCRCVPPATGVPGLMGPTVCKLDECVSRCPTCAGSTCTDAGQACVDENTDPVKGLNTWECRCIAPASGSKRTAAAVCVVNECEVHGSTCTTVNQDCEDPSNTVTGDWRCECRAPLQGQSTASVAACVVDECTLEGAGVCATKGQTCYDPDTAADARGDWLCQCVAPWTGSAVAKAAVCTVDECKVHGSVCRAAGQTCIDTEPSIEGFWYCVCPPPQQKKQKSGGVAECSVDECEAPGNTTAVPVSGEPNVCEAAGQTCEDPDTAPDALGDWLCRCAGSNFSAVANVAVCEEDECARPENAATCAGQLCIDPDWHKVDTWECRCVPPSVGFAVMALATCATDECMQQEQACHAFGQQCVDTDPVAEGTWECHCPELPGVQGGKALMGAAECTPPESECQIEAVRDTCTSHGQACVDPDVSVSGDWMCECLPPAQGANTVGGPATCELDECTNTCTTCAGKTCSAVGQTCRDPNTGGNSLADWMCMCPSDDKQGKQSGAAVGRAATCSLDECAEVCPSCADHGEGNTCGRVGLLCEDPNMDARSTSDWMCVCPPPATGRKTLAIPVCAVDECKLPENQMVCTPSEGQVCVDPDTDAGSRGDFECRCPEGMTGVGVGRAARCILNECNLAANFHKCEEQGQVCIDPKPTPAARDDWECHCAKGGVFAVMAPAECKLDECAAVCDTCANKGGGNVCELAGQTCFDANPSPTSTNDWMCTCPTGFPSATANVATCQVDECMDVTNFGALTCKEVPRKTLDGCLCKCGWEMQEQLGSQGVGPGIDSPCNAGCCNPTGRAGGPWCLIDADHPDNIANPKCAELLEGPVAGQVGTCDPQVAAWQVQNVCEKQEQMCVDPNRSPQSVGDWRCECLPPMFGEPVTRAAAVCMRDECASDAARVCAAHGQVCKDPTQEVDDWVCVCPKGSTGADGAQKAATCTFTGECVANAHVCTQVGQACFDPDVKTDGDWVCQCAAPAIGVSSRGSPAVCKLDECVAECPTCADKGAGSVCEAVGQTCEETSASPADLGDWRCVCPPGQAGSSAAAPAECLVDECLLNNGRLAALCAAAGQTCVDPNTHASDGTGDWKCVCAAPYVGEATAKVASCKTDECAEAKNMQVCSAAGQTCEDPNPDALVTGDWVCRCIDAQSEDVNKTAVGAPAPCTVPETSWCTVHGEKCTSQGQVCVSSPDAGAPGFCACVAPQTGERQAGGPATCVLDECSAVCDTCADQDGKGNLCMLNGQTCIEGSTSLLAVSDWRCACCAHEYLCTMSKASAVAAVAQCSYNECDGPGKVCVKEEQTCVDPDASEMVTGDWYCACAAPSVGKKVGGVAVCTYDECLIHEKECTAKGQTCHDPKIEAGSRGDWECRCVSPAKGSAVGKPAVCEYVGECHTPAIAAVCTDAGQSCYDPDEASVGDWECRCVSPRVGDAVRNAPAQCVLDECRATCGTCATKPGSQTHACLSAGQECVDANTDAASTGDWRCKCPQPQIGEQRGAAAVCEADECAVAANRDTCAQAVDAKGKPMQLCHDPDTQKSGDWVCMCTWPYVGAPAAREVAMCRLDECSVASKWLGGKANGNEVCSQKGQLCVDPQQDVDAVGNWMCTCPDANDGVQVGAPVAQCKTETLCAEHGSTCGAGQMCAERNGAWWCQCIAPLAGEAREAAAVCVLDECRSRCETCAQQGLTHVCGAADQSCVDADTSASSLSDWRCVCKNGKGSAAAAAAECMVDECGLNGVICTGKGQVCRDPDMSAGSTGDWLCLCQAPASGSAVGGPASCLVDECSQHGTVCLDAGQMCVDQNKGAQSLGDWTCNCPEPAQGSMVAGAAACTYVGGCAVEANAKVCAAAEQKCVPGANATNTDDWRCACLPPFHGLEVGVRKPAVCIVNECDDICPTCARTSVESINVCTASGQGCVDPNMGMESLGDWVCQCAPPATATAVGRPVDKCLVDECVAVTQKGARQCEHFRRFTTDGCECACGWQLPEAEGPGIGAGFAEPCNSGCCNPTRSGLGDWCILESNEFNRANPKCAALLGASKRQTCAEPGAPAPAGASQPAVTDVCMEKGQVCVDPDHSPSVTGNWECRCADGTEMQEGKCVHDECRNVTTCYEGGQRCRDPNTAQDSVGDWVCECVTGSGEATGALATCEFPDGDECKENQATCKDAKQYCFDPDTTVDGDWECRCAEPSVTAKVGQQAPAECELDECSAKCATCADRGDGKGSACRGQRCVDGSVSAAGDWRCECIAPALGSAAGTHAVCVLDECADTEIAGVCTRAGQVCHDQDKSDLRLNDWMCMCEAPATGSALISVAKCTKDECLDGTIADTCRKAGQACYDPNPTGDALGDWKCRCPLPATGEATGSPATCQFVGECQDEAVSSVCTSAGQTCVDPDVGTEGDWQCVCVAPQRGVSGKMAPAKCGTDECTAACEGCEMGTCAAAGQKCVDPNVEQDGDWQCACRGVQVGEPAVGQPASCSAVVCADTSEMVACNQLPSCMWDDQESACVGTTVTTRCEGLEQTTCRAQELCDWDTGRDMCVSVGGWNTATLTLLEANETNGTGLAAFGGDGDDDCVLCWLLPLLLLLCCSCCLAAFLLCRRRQQQNEADDEKWNKQFEAEVEEGDSEQNLGLGERSPSKGSEAHEGLLERDSEEMSQRSPKSTVHDDDI